MAAKVNQSIWHWLSQLVIALLALAAFFGVVFWYWPLFKENERMRKQILLLEKDIRQFEEKSRKLQISIQALKDDPKTLERMAREKLGYARPGETVIYFDKPQATNANAVAFPR